MHKIIEEFNVGVKNFFVLTLNEQMPHGRYKKCRIDGKEYEIHFMRFSGCSSVEVALDNMFRNFAIKAPEGGSFVGKEVEFVFI